MFPHPDDDSWDGPINPHTEAIAEAALIWSDADPSRCHCHGSGYWLSQFDTWERCGAHWTQESIHPEHDLGGEG